MRRRLIGALSGALGAIALTGCGLVYTSPSVSEGGFFGKYTADMDVEVVPMTYETTVSANLMPSVPSRLPLGLQPGATQDLAATLSFTPPQLGPLPTPPSRPGIRPGSVPMRLPPLEPPQPYRIGVADVLLLSVNAANAQLEDLPGLISAQAKRQGFIVQDDGAIAIPDAGRVRVAGLTLQDAEAAIFQALVSAGIDPSFSLEIAEFNSQRVAVGGEVRNPALVPITLKPLYLYEAINAAGGLLVDDTKVARIVLTRDDELYQIGLQRFIEDPTIRDIVLRDGDSVFVETEFREERARSRFAEELALREELRNETLFQFQVADIRTRQEQILLERLNAERQIFLDRVELGAVARHYAYLAGEVPIPMRVPLPFENTAVLTDVLFNERVRGISINSGDYSEIYVLRRPPNPEEAGSVIAYHLNANNAANLALAGMFEMHDGDVVFVAEQPITAWNRALSQALPQLFASFANVATGL